MIGEVKAKFFCDECGEGFTVDLDPARVAPTGWSLFDVAADQIRAEGCGSVEDERHYCDSCTTKRDAQVAD